MHNNFKKKSLLRIVMVLWGWFGLLSTCWNNFSLGEKTVLVALVNPFHWKLYLLQIIIYSVKPFQTMRSRGGALSSTKTVNVHVYQQTNQKQVKADVTANRMLSWY